MMEWILLCLLGIVTMICVLGILEVIGNWHHRKEVQNIREELKTICRYRSGSDKDA